jgi:hypothetical protein
MLRKEEHGVETPRYDRTSQSLGLVDLALPAPEWV